MADAIFLIRALGIEILGAWEADLHGATTVTYCLLYSLEEMLEIPGILLYIYSLLSRLANSSHRRQPFAQLSI